MNEFEDSDFGSELNQLITEKGFQEMQEEEQEALEERQRLAKQKEVNNLQEAANVLPDAGRAIVEDIAKYGGAEPSWMNTPDDGPPELKTTWGKTLSDITQVVAPLLAIGFTKGKALKMMRNRGMLKSIPVGGKADRFGNLAFDVGSEVGWYNVSRQAEQDNLSGQLADLGVPVPGWLATGDNDNKEAKRVKQQLEAVGLGVFGSMLSGLFRLGKQPVGRFINRLRGKDAASEEYINQLAKKGGQVEASNPAVDELTRDEALRQASDGEMAQKRFADKGGVIPDPWDETPDNYIQSGMFDEVERVPKAVPAEGLVEAVVDNYEITKQPYGNGRMQRFMSDAALDAISAGDLEKRTIIKGIEAQLNDFASKNLDVDVGGRWKNNKEVVAAMDNLVAAMMDLSLEDMKKVIRYDEVTVGPNKKIKVVDPFMENAMIKLSKRYLDEFSFDRQRASALAQTSLANDISDSAVAVSAVKNEIDVTRTQERLLDMVEFLQYEQTLAGSYSGWRLNARKNGLGLTNKDVDVWKADAAKAAAEVRQYAEEVKQLRITNPKMADAATAVYELTNGSVRDVNDMAKAIRDSVKGRRVAKNWGYKSPALFVEGVSSLFYAFKLSSLYTPIKAVMNNMANFIMKPITQVLGGADGRRAWAQYVNGAVEYNKIAAKIMSDRYKQVQNLPVTELARQDYKDRILQQQDWLKAAQDYADASGDLLFQQKVNFANTMIAIGNSKYLRYSTNMMEAGDAGLNVALVLTDKRAKLLDEILVKNGKVTGKDIKDIDEWIKRNGATYAKGALDADMKPLDEALRYQAGEIAMNLDNQVSTNVGSVLNKVPILKAFVLFPKTILNSLSFMNKFSPTSHDLFRVNTLKDPKQIEDFLKLKGIPYSEENWLKFSQETRGRVILGSSVMGYAWTAWATGNMTGNGKYDKTTNRMNKDLAERPTRSWRLAPGTPWISYDGIEPISSLLALTVDLADNFDTLGKGRFEDLGKKLAFIFADNITNRTFAQGLRPLFDLMLGRPGGVGGVVANMGSVSIINQLGRTIDPAYRQVENDFLSQLRNKWSILDSLGIGEPLPYDYNVVTGKKVEPLNFVGSSLIPVRLSKTQTRAQEILTEIDFPVNAAIDSIAGIELKGQQKSRLKQIVGERGVFAKDIVKYYNNPRSQNDLKELRRLRAAGVNSDQVSYGDNYLIGKLTESLTREIKYAKSVLLREDAKLKQQMNLNYNLKRATQLSDYEKIERLLEIN